MKVLAKIEWSNAFNFLQKTPRIRGVFLYVVCQFFTYSSEKKCLKALFDTKKCGILHFFV